MPRFTTEGRNAFTYAFAGRFGLPPSQADTTEVEKRGACPPSPDYVGCPSGWFVLSAPTSPDGPPGWAGPGGILGLLEPESPVGAMPPLPDSVSFPCVGAPVTPPPPLTWSAADEQALQQLAERKKMVEAKHLDRLKDLCNRHFGMGVSNIRAADLLRAYAQDFRDALQPFVKA